MIAMAALLLGAGALIAIDKDDREVAVLLRAAQQRRRPLRTGATVVAQVWRGGRQANLPRMLAGIDVRPLDRGDAHRAGELLGVTGTTDVPDAHLALLAEPGDEVLTGDPEDLERLIAARAVAVRVVRL